MLHQMVALKHRGSFLAVTSVKSSRKLFITIIYETIFWIEVSEKAFHQNLKTEALVKHYALAHTVA